MKAKKIFAVVLAGAPPRFPRDACGGGETKKVESPADFEGAKVSVQTATTAHDSLQEMQAEGVNVEILPHEKVTQCFDDLELGRCDAVYVDSVVAAYYLTGEEDKFQSVWKSEEGEPMGICLKKGQYRHARARGIRHRHAVLQRQDGRDRDEALRPRM